MVTALNSAAHLHTLGTKATAALPHAKTLARTVHVKVAAGKTVVVTTATPPVLPPAARRVQVALGDLEQALIAGKILCYAQGFAMMAAAGRDFGWALDMPGVARVWRAGCIIRSDMLNDMAEALADGPGRNLILAPGFAARLTDTLPALRRVVAAGALHGLALPALGAGLAWFDMMRTARGTANMIQGQRDFFGAHGFDRLDGADRHHGPWGAH